MNNKETWDDYLQFEKEHPEIDVALMEDAYEKCQGKQATLKEIYEHVYGRRCSWCQTYIRNSKAVEKSGKFISKVADWQVGRY